MKWALYNILFLIVYPFLLPGFLVRMLKRGGYAARMGDRFALYPEFILKALGRRDTLSDSHASTFNLRPPTSDLIWIHAVSVGEVQVAGQLMREWRKADPSVRFCFSTTSSTGWKMAERELASLDALAPQPPTSNLQPSTSDLLIYNPLDFPTFVRAALHTVRPRAIVLSESEIWPNFIRKAKKYGIPLYLINARVSDRCAPRYRAARFFFKDVLRSFTRIFAQSDLDKARLVAAGADERTVEVTGSFKFDVAHRSETKEKELESWIGPHPGGILLGGSTWPGEDELLLRAYRRILDLQPPTSDLQPVLVIAPRHFEKADEVEANIRKAGFACVRRSRGEGGGRETRDERRERTKDEKTKDLQPPTSNLQPVFLADTTGELMGLYGIADVVFVGKSMCAHGSQNMIEPCLCGKPTFVGPYTENFRPVMSDLKSADAIVQAQNAQALEDGLVAAFAERTDARWTRLGERARAAVERRCGVVARCVGEIRRTLVVLLVVCAFAGCSRKDEPETKPAVRQTCEAVKATVRGIYRLEKSVAVDATSPRFVSLDVEGLTAEAFRAKLLAFTNAANAHLWMPGEKSWIVVEQAASNTVGLAWAMDAFAQDASCTVSVPEVFASYVGTVDEVLPAFAAKLEGDVLPEWFVTKEIPSLPWLDTSGVDPDILKSTLDEIRSMQVIRRLILEGNILSRRAKDKKDEEAVTDKWRRAYLRNPHDPLLLERLDVLERNARGFLEVGKTLQAMKCYEMMIYVNPNDAVAVRNFGLCLRKLGRQDMAKQVLARAKELESKSGRKAE